MTNSAPERMPCGQRVVTALRRVYEGRDRNERKHSQRDRQEIDAVRMHGGTQYHEQRQIEHHGQRHADQREPLAAYAIRQCAEKDEERQTYASNACVSASVPMAARALGVDHATVGRRVQSLEQATRLTLFERHLRGYALTRQGERLLAVAEAMEREAGRVAENVEGVFPARCGSAH